MLNSHTGRVALCSCWCPFLSIHSGPSPCALSTGPSSSWLGRFAGWADPLWYRWLSEAFCLQFRRFVTVTLTSQLYYSCGPPAEGFNATDNILGCYSNLSELRAQLSFNFPFIWNQGYDKEIQSDSNSQFQSVSQIQFCQVTNLGGIKKQNIQKFGHLYILR